MEKALGVLKELGIMVLDEDGNYRSSVDVFADISKLMENMSLNEKAEILTSLLEN